MKTPSNTCASQLLAILLLGASPLVLAEEPTFSPQTVRDVGEKLRRMETVKLDLAPVLQAGKGGQLAAARALVGQILAQGDSMLAMHALTFLGYYPDPAWQPVLLKRRALVGTETWADQQFALSLDTYLAKIGDESGQRRLPPYLQNPDSTFRMRTYRALRDINPAEFPEKLRAETRALLAATAETETDPAAQAGAFAALVLWEPARATDYIHRLKDAAESTDPRTSLRAATELNQLRNWNAELHQGELTDLAPAVALSTKRDTPFRRRLTTMNKGAHGERMFAIELLAQLDVPAITQMLKAQGNAGQWQDRLRSAFYLFMTSDKAEARQRLTSEAQPFVQLALLSTLITDPR